MDRLYELLPSQTPNLDEVRPTIDFGNGAFTNPGTGTAFQSFFILKSFGEIQIPVGGDYEFALESDDGSFLWINNNEVINNDGTHGPETVTGSVTLTAGWHPISIGAFNDVGDFLLRLRWKQPGDAGVSTTQVAGSGLAGTVQMDESTGMEWVNGELFIAERTGVFRLLDDNLDGLFEAKERIGDTWAWDSFHQFALCLKHRAEADVVHPPESAVARRARRARAHGDRCLAARCPGAMG